MSRIIFNSLIRILIGLEYQMTRQNVPLDPLNKITIYLEYLGQQKKNHLRANLKKYFFQVPKKIIFHKVVHDYDFTCHSCILRIPSYPYIILQFFPALSDT